MVVRLSGRVVLRRFCGTVKQTYLVSAVLEERSPYDLSLVFSPDSATRKFKMISQNLFANTICRYFVDGRFCMYTSFQSSCIVAPPQRRRPQYTPT